MCFKCNDTGYVQEQRESTLFGGKAIFYEVHVECGCSKVPKPEKPQIIKKTRNHEWWKD